MRRGWKRGNWLVKDQESGFTTYGTKVAYDYYGVLKDKRQLDRAHPQDFIRPGEDPHPVDPVNPPFRQYDEACLTNQGFTVGTTSVPAPTGAATHLFRPAIGTAQIGCTFYVY